MSKTDTTAKSKNSMATFFKVLRFIGKYRFLLVLSVILAAVTVILQLFVPVLFVMPLMRSLLPTKLILQEWDSIFPVFLS